MAPQAPLSMAFLGQECLSGLVFPAPGEPPNPGIKPRSTTLQVVSLPTEPPGKPRKFIYGRVHHEKRWAGGGTSWNQNCQEKYQYLRYADDTTLPAESGEELKEPLDESERGQ